MRIVFCDDDSVLLKQLEDYVYEYFEITNEKLPEFASYSSGKELLEHETTVDIAFLDVEMPGMNGIEVGSKLKAFNPRMLLFVVTSHLEYLDDAMRLQSFRYVIKPVDKRQLYNNLDDAMYQYNTLTKEIAVYTMEGVSVVSADKIVCIEASGHYTSVYTTEQVLHSKDSIGYWNDILTLPCFFKSHRSYIVNMRYVSKFSPKEIELRYKGNVVRAKLSRLLYNSFQESYFPYLERIK